MVLNAPFPQTWNKSLWELPLQIPDTEDIYAVIGVHPSTEVKRSII
jgi:hypothetical protein